MYYFLCEGEEIRLCGRICLNWRKGSLEGKQETNALPQKAGYEQGR